MYFFAKVKKAFFALVANSLRAAPLWDSNMQRFVGKMWFKLKSPIDLSAL